MTVTYKNANLAVTITTKSATTYTHRLEKLKNFFLLNHGDWTILFKIMKSQSLGNTALCYVSQKKIAISLANEEGNVNLDIHSKVF